MAAVPSYFFMAIQLLRLPHLSSLSAVVTLAATHVLTLSLQPTATLAAASPVHHSPSSPIPLPFRVIPVWSATM
jgi:hypothetical protein